MIFTVYVVDKAVDEKQSDEALAIVRYYVVKASTTAEAAQNLTLRHLVWERQSVQSRKPCSSQPSYGFVVLGSKPAFVPTLQA